MARFNRPKKWVSILVYLCLACFALTIFNKAAGGLTFLPFMGAPRSALVSMVKQRDRFRVIEAVRNVEDRFNREFKHDWVFLSEEDFKPDFIKEVSAFVSGKAHFRTINRQLHWTMPNTIDRNQLRNDMTNLDMQGVPYGGSLTYRLMSRFQTLFIAEYLPEYRYYARIDPDVRLHCDVDHDIFATMWQNGLKYGFAISLHEVPHATHDLSKTVNAFMKSHAELIHPNQWLDSFIRPWDEFCHFWSNFEVVDLDFYRSEKYKKLVQYLEFTGGIFYNRWGDAPIHSVAAALFLDPKEVHWFGDIGMSHPPNTHCPPSLDDRIRLRCLCPANDEKIFTYTSQSCVPQFLNLTGEPFQNGWQQHAEWSVVNAFEEQN